MDISKISNIDETVSILIEMQGGAKAAAITEAEKADALSDDIRHILFDATKHSPTSLVQSGQVQSLVAAAEQVTKLASEMQKAAMSAAFYSRQCIEYSKMLDELKDAE